MIPVPRQKLDKLVTKMRHYDIHPIYLPDAEMVLTQLLKDIHAL